MRFPKLTSESYSQPIRCEDSPWPCGFCEVKNIWIVNDQNNVAPQSRGLPPIKIPSNSTQIWKAESDCFEMNIILFIIIFHTALGNSVQKSHSDSIFKRHWLKTPTYIRTRTAAITRVSWRISDVFLSRQTIVCVFITVRNQRRAHRPVLSLFLERRILQAQKRRVL